MKGKVTVELERFVAEALRGMEPLAGLEKDPPWKLLVEAKAYLRAVLNLVPIDRGPHYRVTEARVLREIAARMREPLRPHFPLLSEKHIEAVAGEVA
jgi:hypothetical protein